MTQVHRRFGAPRSTPPHPFYWALRCLMTAIILVQVACRSGESSQSVPPHPGAAVFPAASVTSSASTEDTTNNPWLHGFGGGLPVPTGAPADSAQSPDRSAHETRPAAVGASDGSTSSSSDPSGSADDEAEQTSEESPSLQLVEYFEGKGSDKLLAVHNLGTTEHGTCFVDVYVNGGIAPWRSMPIVPFPHPGATVVLCSEAFTERFCDGTISGSTFNGNDALVLRCEGKVTDSFGQVGHDPETGWKSTVSPGKSTKDARWIRCGRPDLEPSDPFDLDAAWILGDPKEPFAAAQTRCAPAPGEGGAGG